MIDVNVLIEVGKLMHKKYDELWWKKASFHNVWHVDVSIKAVTELMKAAQNGVDPCLLSQSLERWNDKMQTNFNWDDLQQIFSLAYSWHDIGNILGRVNDGMKKAKLNLSDCAQYLSENFESEKIIEAVVYLDNQGYQYLDRYRTEKAVLRSKRVFETVTHHYGIRSDYQNLALYLMDQSTWMYEQMDDEFGLAWRVVDYCSAGFWDKTAQEVLTGLIVEWKEESSCIVNMDYQINFSRRRMAELFQSNIEPIDKVQRVWQRSLPDEDYSWAGRELAFEEALEELRNQEE